MMLRTVIVTSALVAFATSAGAIEGRYRVEGANPGGRPGSYQGEAIVKKTGDTYTVGWQIGPTRQAGTGILTGDVLSVVFQTVGANSYGVASFKVVDGQVRSGSWALFGATAAGTERWTFHPGE